MSKLFTLRFGDLHSWCPGLYTVSDTQQLCGFTSCTPLSVAHAAQAELLSMPSHKQCFIVAPSPNLCLRWLWQKPRCLHVRAHQANTSISSLDVVCCALTQAWRQAHTRHHPYGHECPPLCGIGVYGGPCGAATGS